MFCFATHCLDRSVSETLGVTSWIALKGMKQVVVFLNNVFRLCISISSGRTS